jgi:beta-galactosidase/beta-glucuronidase
VHFDPIHQLFIAAQLATVDAMVDSASNNPSVIVWAFLNEGESDDASVTSTYATMAAAFRKRDASRLVTWASNTLEADKGLEHADVVAFNAYPG